MNEGIDCRQCNPKGLAEFTTHAEWCPAVTQRMRQTKLARAQTDFATYRADVEPLAQVALALRQLILQRELGTWICEADSDQLRAFATTVDCTRACVDAPQEPPTDYERYQRDRPHMLKMAEEHLQETERMAGEFAAYRADVEPVLRAAVDYEACEEFEVSDKQMALSDAIAASRVCQRIAREGK